MDSLAVFKFTNLAWRFLLEVISIIAIGYWGFKIDKGVVIQYVVGLGGPLLIIVIWAMFGSPSAPFKLQGIYRIALEFSIYGLAFVAILLKKGHIWAIVFAGSIVINTFLLYLWKQ